jgi:thiol-disulfide isomerase/thioredoxin
VINKIIDANPGKVIYIDFWALWCYPCISNLNTSLKLINELTGKDVLFVNICIMTSRDLWEESYKSEHDQIISLHMNTQEANAVMRQFRFSGVPYGILINKEGYVVDFGNHVRAESDYLKADILKLLEN